MLCRRYQEPEGTLVFPEIQSNFIKILFICIAGIKLLIFILYFSRVDDSFKRALDFFKTFTIDNEVNVANVYEMFVNIQNIYTNLLRNSIEEEIKDGRLANCGNPNFYTYVILDAKKLYKILDEYNGEVFTPADVLNEHVDELKENIDYVGKGKATRNFDHAIDCKKLLEGKKTCRKENRKTDKIIDSWENGNGIVILRLSAETTHFEAHAREYAVIKSVGINNITNIINGTPYGMMKTWNSIEFENYGTMILYKALKMCINKPQELFTVMMLYFLEKSL